MAHRHFASAAVIARRPDLARAALPEAMALAERVGDAHQLAALHYIMGGVHESDGDFGAELRHARRVLELIGPEVDPRLAVRTYTMIGFCHAKLGDLGASRRHLLRSAGLAHEYGNLDSEAFAEANLCHVDYLTGEYTRAVEHGRRAVGMFEACGDVRAVAFVSTNLGECYREMGAHEEARRWWHRARDYYTAHQPDAPELDRVSAGFAFLATLA